MKDRWRLLLVLSLVGQTVQAQEINLLFAGDAMQHKKQIDNALRKGEYDYSSYFTLLEPEITAADLAVVNLEVTLGGKPYTGYPQFSAPDAFAVALKTAGFDLFLNANNHILDRSAEGLCRTLSVLDSLEVKHTGAFRNADERRMTYPLLIDKNGVRLAFLNYTYGTNGIEPTDSVVVNYIDTLQIKADINRARELQADIVIANMHWGNEYKLLPNAAQTSLADRLIAEGVDIVMGGHPHVVQPSKVLRDSTGTIRHVLIYSLGNFVSGMKAVNTDGGQLVCIKLKKADGRTIIADCSYSLVYVAKKAVGRKIDYQVLPIVPLATGKSPWRQRRFVNKARALFKKYNQGISER